MSAVSESWLVEADASARARADYGCYGRTVLSNASQIRPHHRAVRVIVLEGITSRIVGSGHARAGLTVRLVTGRAGLINTYMK